MTIMIPNLKTRVTVFWEGILSTIEEAIRPEAMASIFRAASSMVTAQLRSLVQSSKFGGGSNFDPKYMDMEDSEMSGQTFH